MINHTFHGGMMSRRDTESGNSGSPMIYYMKFIGPDSEYYKSMMDESKRDDALNKMVPQLPIPQSNR